VQDRPPSRHFDFDYWLLPVLTRTAFSRKHFRAGVARGCFRQRTEAVAVVEV